MDTEFPCFVRSGGHNSPFPGTAAYDYGLALSSGLSICSTEAKKASTSTWSISLVAIESFYYLSLKMYTKTCDLAKILLAKASNHNLMPNLSICQCGFWKVTQVTDVGRL